MMELRHLAMVNWHLFDIEDIEVGGHIGVLGENRSGKSTVLDMAQVVLTGANHKFQRLNAVAGESTRGRGGSPKRSIVGYCLGALGEDQFRRDEARTYVALGFVDTAGARPPVTIGLALEARKSESSETVLARFVAIGKILKAEDFIEVRQGRRYPAAWDEVRGRIVAAVGTENFISHRDKPGDYVREYMRHLLPHVGYVEQNATSLQKAVVNAMTRNQTHTATDFVRQFILEENPIRVGELRESIQTYRGINATIQKMREKLEALKGLQAILLTFEEALERRYREQWIARRADWLAARAANREFSDRVRVHCGQRDAARAEMDFFDEEIRGIDKDIERLVRAIAEHDAKSGRQGLQRALTGAQEAAIRAEGDFRKRMRAIQALAPIAALRHSDFDALIAAVDKLRMLAQDARIGALPEGLADAEAALLAAAPDLLARVAERRQRLFRDLGDKEDARDKLMERVRQHAAGHSAAHLEESTQLLCRRLRHSGMAPRVLCELVEVADPEWVGAAEALLGRDREAVFVDRADIGAATAIFKEGRREFRGAALVSLNKLDEFRTPPAPDTFPSIFRTDDRDAMSFIMRRYGSVRLA